MVIFHQKATPGFLLAQITATALTFTVVAAALQFRDIDDALASYGVYHREPLNQLIHFFGVPGLTWSVLMMAAHLPLPILGSYNVSLPGMRPHAISWATASFLFYSCFYIYIDQFGGILFAATIYMMYMTATNWAWADQEAQRKKTSSKEVSWVGTGRILKLALAINVFCWYVQIHPGHAILEGAKPAILDSLGGALTSAPLFAFYEGLWFFNINKGLQVRTAQLVAEYTAKICAEGATMRACANL